jgi:CRISPR-associated protein Cas2
MIAMNDAKWWLVCYDVHDPARLRRTAKHLEGSGQRMQESVFRCWMTPSQMHCLRWELTEILEPHDEVLIIPLCPRCVAGMETTHTAQNTPNWPDAPDPYRIV